MFRRKGKLLLALRACNAAVRCSPSSFAARRNVAHLAAIVSSSDCSGAVKTVLDDGVKTLTGGATAAAYAQALVAEASSSLEGALAAEAVKLAGGDAGVAAAKVGDLEVPRRVDDAIAAVAALERVGAGVGALIAKLAVAFPYCDAFGGAKATKRA